MDYEAIRVENLNFIFVIIKQFGSIEKSMLYVGRTCRLLFRNMLSNDIPIFAPKYQKININQQQQST